MTDNEMNEMTVALAAELAARALRNVIDDDLVDSRGIGALAGRILIAEAIKFKARAENSTQEKA